MLRAGGAGPEDAQSLFECAVKRRTQTGSQAALEQLCRDYWYPLYAFIRRKGRSPDDAAVLTQGFFAKRLANDFAQGISPDGGRFRSFLLTSLNRFLIDEWQKGQRQKRGGARFIRSLEALIHPLGDRVQSIGLRDLMADVAG